MNPLTDLPQLFIGEFGRTIGMFYAYEYEYLLHVRYIICIVLRLALYEYEYLLHVIYIIYIILRLALYVYEYLLHVGAQKAAQTFLNEVFLYFKFF